MKTRMICRGPLAGTYSKEDAEALGEPKMTGHARRGRVVEEPVYQRDESGNVVLDDEDNSPVIEKTIHRVVPCGFDLTEQYDAVPADGKDHFIKCPRCGNVSRAMKTPADDDGE